MYREIVNEIRLLFFKQIYLTIIHRRVGEQRHEVGREWRGKYLPLFTDTQEAIVYTKLYHELNTTRSVIVRCL